MTTTATETKEAAAPKPSLRDLYGAPVEQLSDGNLTLKRYKDGDAEAAYEAATTTLPELIMWMTWASEDYNLESTKGFVTFAQTSWDDGTEYSYGAFVDGAFVGSFSLMAPLEGDGADIGYWLSKPATGKGIATRATKLLIKAAWDANYPNVQIRHDVRNVKSEAIPKRLGFTYLHTKSAVRKGENLEDKLWQLRRESA